MKREGGGGGGGGGGWGGGGGGGGGGKPQESAMSTAHCHNVCMQNYPQSTGNKEPSRW